MRRAPSCRLFPVDRVEDHNHLTQPRFSGNARSTTNQGAPGLAFETWDTTKPYPTERRRSRVGHTRRWQGRPPPHSASPVHQERNSTMTTHETAVRRCVKAYYDACDVEDPNTPASTREALYNRVHLGLPSRHMLRPISCPTPTPSTPSSPVSPMAWSSRSSAPAKAAKLLYAAQVAIGSSRAHAQKCHPGPKAKDPRVTPTPSPVEGSEAAVRPHRRCANSQPSRAPSMATASSSPGLAEIPRIPTSPNREQPHPPPSPHHKCRRKRSQPHRRCWRRRRSF